MVEVKRTNPSAFVDLDLKLKQLEGYEGRVGWFESSKYHDSGTPVAYVAAIQELGYGPIPPRPFMRPAESKNQNAWKDVAAKSSKAILAGKITGQQGMDLISERARQDVEQAIVDVNNPPLSPITLWARLYRRQGKKITGKTIGEIAAGIASGALDAAGPPGVSKKPLNDTGYMLDQLRAVVVST